MSELLNLFYRQSLGLIFWGAVLAAVVFQLLWKRYGSRRWFRCGCALLMIFWAYVMLRLTVLYRTPGCCSEWYVLPLRFLWEMYTTGNTELWRTMFMNAMLFFPAGLLVTALLPRTWSRRRTVLTVCGIFFTVSAAVECTQFVMAFGRAEADDLLFNVLGACLGTIPILTGSKG